MKTNGINHLGLTVRDLDTTVAFFVSCLGWTEGPRDDSYPRSSVSDGHCRLTLWQANQSPAPQSFDRKANIGLHHLALEVESEAALTEAHVRLLAYPGVCIEFGPEPLGNGPRKHMMFSEPGGIRLELIWPGS